MAQSRVSIQYSVELDNDCQSPTYYANTVSVGHTTHDLLIQFGAVVPPVRVDDAHDRVVVPVIARVTIPPALVPVLVYMLHEEFRKQQDESMGVLKRNWDALRATMSVAQSASNEPEANTNE